jgi:hypothetical protein
MEVQGDGNTAFRLKFAIFSRVLDGSADVFNGSTRAEMFLRRKCGRCI